MKIEPGDLMMIQHAPDQPPWTRDVVGKKCIVIRNLTQADGVSSSPNIWEVLVEGKKLSVHRLDLTWIIQ